MKLEEKKGFKYTQSAEVEIKNRIIATVVYLAVNDSKDNWKQITDEEANKIKEQQKLLHEAEMKEREAQMNRK